MKINPLPKTETFGHSAACLKGKSVPPFAQGSSLQHALPMTPFPAPGHVQAELETWHTNVPSPLSLCVLLKATLKLCRQRPLE